MLVKNDILGYKNREIFQDDECFSFSLDSVMLANFATIRLRDKNILDLGCTTNGTKEIKNASDWNNGNGGLKVIFYGKDKTPQAFMWMRPSGTENVFRIMCDVKGNRPQMEESLLQWETSMITKADAL